MERTGCAKTGGSGLPRGWRLGLLTALCAAASTAGAPPAQANNLNVSSASLTGSSPTTGTIKVQFDIAWDNSWRSAANYDAAWVFVKYSTDAGATWSHATLKTSGTNPSGFSTGTGTAIDLLVPADKTGAFLQRSANGTGTTSVSNVQVVWDYAADGVFPTATVRVKVLAIEMVYVPAGSFDLGDGNGSAESTTAFHTGTGNAPVQITTALAGDIQVDANTYDDDQLELTGVGVDGDGGLDSDDNGAVDNPDFPTGYGAFYLMKHEISQGQYADFLNTITAAQASTRYPNQNGSFRHTISGSYPNYTASRPDRASNYLSWADVAAYADWAALRPMTELEFEKAARGTAAAVYQEYAWGTTTIAGATTISGSENGAETANGNCAYNNVTFTGGDGGQGPLRAGIFATGSSTRQDAGAGAYGALELSGNLWERTVTVGSATGRAFTGAHGDGALDGTGNANTSNWPGTNAVGAGFRGGAWSNGSAFARSSDRFNAANTSASRSSNGGGRAARTSP